MIKEAISKLVERISLSESEAMEVMREITEGKATPAQIAAYLVSLRMKGETVEEVTGSVAVMREKVTKIRVTDPTVVDTCGTGGDRRCTFNISTTAAFVVAGAGITVAKHGNRSVSSRCGSADVLKELGVRIDLPPEGVEECINEIGIGFLFAPLFHPSMKHAVGPRQEIGIRSLFNIVGPLTNPAGAAIQVVGVFEEPLTDLVARVLISVGSRHCFVVHGMDGLDEITTCGRTKVSEGKNGVVASYYIEPRDFGIRPGRPQDLLGGGPEDNALILRDVLKGKMKRRREIVLLNAAPAIVASGKARTLKEAIEVAAQSIDSGAALAKLEELKKVTHRLK